MDFKQMLREERLVFLNPKEFGEKMVIDNIPVFGIWDDVEEPSAQFYSTATVHPVSGVNVIERILFAVPQSEDNPLALPQAEEELDIDGTRWLVRDSKDEAGIIELTLYRNVS